MDYVTTPDALHAIVRMIERDVIPAVADGYVVGQLWAASGLLGNIAGELERAGIEGERDGVLAVASPTDETAPTEDAPNWGAQADEVAAQLAEVIGSHSSLHYRRAIAGFGS